jgi:hypothetical protein
MSSMSDVMLSEEAVARATRRLQAVLTLVQLSFEAGSAAARRLGAHGVIVDPVATCCFGDARELLLRPVPNLPLALLALQLAACREPACYGPTHAAMNQLLFRAVDEAVEAELAATVDDDDEAAAKQHE